MNLTDCVVQLPHLIDEETEAERDLPKGIGLRHKAKSQSQG